MNKKGRRDKGLGSIYQRKDGRWEGKLRRDGFETVCVYGKTKQDVMNKLFVEPRKPRMPDASLTVGEWLDKWLEMVKTDRRKATYSLYKSTVDNHIRPHLGKIALRRLTRSQVYDMLDALKSTVVGKKKKRPFGGRSLQMVHNVLHRALQVAMKRDKVSTNVVAMIDKPIASKKERTILQNEEQVRKFREAAAKSDYHALYILALDTGLRQGEILALKWENVDLVKRHVQVKATLTRDEEGQLVATTPKTTSSIRTVSLPEMTAQVLRLHQRDQMASKRGLSPWVFVNSVGDPLYKDGILRKDFHKVACAAGVPGLTFHGLRHTHATMLAALNVPMRSVMDRLGHSTSRMTLEVYSHCTAASQEQAVSALDSFYQGLEQKIGRQIGRQTSENLGG